MEISLLAAEAAKPGLEESILATVVLPIALGIVMLGLGLSLIPDDFRRALKTPKAVLLGLVCQLVLLPILGFSTALLFGLTGGLAIGLVILTLCPGGVTSNIITFLSKGDLALSVTLTAITSIVTPFTIPLLIAIAFSQFGGAGEVSIPIGKTIGALVLITIVPLSLGMFIRKKKPHFADRSERVVSIASTLFLVLIILGIVRREWANLGVFFGEVGLPALVLNIVAMSAGYGIAKLAKLRREETITIGIEVGIQNGTTAIFIATTLLGSREAAIAPAVYSLIMFGSGAVFGFIVNRPGAVTHPDNAPA